MSQRRIKRHKNRLTEGDQVAKSLLPKLQKLATLRERTDALTELSGDQIRAVLNTDTAVLMLVMACWGGTNGRMVEDYDAMGKMMNNLSALLATYELRKAGYIHWTGSNPAIDDEGTATTQFRMTGSAHFLQTPLSATATRVLGIVQRGCELGAQFIVEEGRAEGVQRGILPMDKTAAREMVIAHMAAESGVPEDTTRSSIEEMEDRGLIGQNDDGSFWVKGPDGLPRVLIPGMFGDPTPPTQ